MLVEVVVGGTLASDGKELYPRLANGERDRQYLSGSVD